MYFLFLTSSSSVPPFNYFGDLKYGPMIADIIIKVAFMFLSHLRTGFEENWVNVLLVILGLVDLVYSRMAQNE